MQPRAALVLGIGAGVAAIGLVALDLAFTLTFRVEAREADGSWTTVALHPRADDYDRFPSFSECVGRAARVVVDNHRPIPAKVAVRVWVRPAVANETELLDETWSLAPFEVRDRELAVPSDSSGKSSSNPYAGMLWVAFDDVVLVPCIRGGT